VSAIRRSPTPDRAWGRFDDVAAGTALAFPASSDVLVARRPSEVVPVLTEVERATERGCWAFGYVAYEAAPGLDPRWRVVEPPDAGSPLVVFALSDSPQHVPVIVAPAGRSRNYTVGPWRRGWTEDGYRADVARVREHIAAGDTYQLNLTVRLHGQATGDLEQLYADLAWGQRGSFAAYLDLGTQVIASASPELFFQWDGAARLVTRPMKGTAPRGRTSAEDAQQVDRLLGSEKERAENVMIVDLLRNDLGQIADVGSVRVPRLLTPERFESVWQLTSDVTADVRPGTGLVEVFRALFPSGSVTGAPKQRTMELIRDLEAESRGVYCGAIGVVAPPGHPYRARFNVAIRTVTVDRTTGSAVYGTGGGITWSSDPDAEHRELLTKTLILTEPYEEFGLIETMAHLPGRGLRNLDRHLARLAGSARYFGFRIDLPTARSRLGDAVREAGPARVRLTLHRDGSLDVDVAPLPPWSRRPVRLALDREPVDSRQRWLHHKTTRRTVYSTRARRHPEADDVVLTNERNQVTETTIANLALQLDGRWFTPPLTAGCLPGVERGRLLERGRLAERDLTAADLAAADGLAVVSSLRGWRTAVLVDRAQVPSGA
jgi:para-aminobenzoate synthetase/4-amino-4-deoxychorismate lyase